MRGLFRKQRPEDRAFEFAQKELYTAFPKAKVLDFTIPDLRRDEQDKIFAIGTVQPCLDGAIGRRCRYVYRFDPMTNRGNLNIEPEVTDKVWGHFDLEYHLAAQQMRCG